MSLNGSLVGVTSHITPLPAGEGLGEGPPSVGPKPCAKSSVNSVRSVREKLTSVREKPPHAPRKQANRGNLTYHSPLHSEKGWG